MCTKTQFNSNFFQFLLINSNPIPIPILSNPIPFKPGSLSNQFESNSISIPTSSDQFYTSILQFDSNSILEIELNRNWCIPTSILSVYGGLTVDLKFLVWNAMSLYRLIKRRFRSRKTVIKPWTNHI